MFKKKKETFLKKIEELTHHFLGQHPQFEKNRIWHRDFVFFVEKSFHVSLLDYGAGWICMPPAVVEEVKLFSSRHIPDGQADIGRFLVLLPIRRSGTDGQPLKMVLYKLTDELYYVVAKHGESLPWKRKVELRKLLFIGPAILMAAMSIYTDQFMKHGWSFSQSAALIYICLFVFALTSFLLKSLKPAGQREATFNNLQLMHKICC